MAPARPTGAAADPFPATLSATGCFDPADTRRPGPALIPYSVNAPLWSDGAAKLRWMALPDSTTIDVAPDGDWVFPVGSVLVKTFLLDGKRIETRLFVRHAGGDWAGYSYEWNDAETGATLLVDGKEKFMGDNDWVFPSRKGCLECHTKAAGGTLGLETAQLNTAFTYPNGRVANQIATLDHLGMFAKSPGDPDRLPRFATPTDAATGSLEARARAYLHANCSNCHRPLALTEVTIDLRFTTPLTKTAACDLEPMKGTFGYDGAKILKPGDPSLSLISLRMHSNVPNVKMPALGRSLVDTQGVAVVDDWIRSLVTCP